MMESLAQFVDHPVMQIIKLIIMLAWTIVLGGQLLIHFKKRK